MKRTLKSSRLLASPRGMTVVVVLGVISITLALSYAMLRSQVTSVEIQSNLDRRAAARQAAYAGVSAAMRKMNDASWQGVDVPLSQDLSDHQWFEVSFETGDSDLATSDAEYSEFPFRVTIHSVGYAADPSQPDIRSTYRVRSVLQLVRKKMYDEPSTWAPVRNYTTYHWSNNASVVEFPVHVEGPVYFQGQLMMSNDYPIDAASRLRYYSDLSAMKAAGLGDYRPFSGPLYTPVSKQTSLVLSLLTTSLGAVVSTITSSTAAPATMPTVTSYQLYPGGKTYTMPVIQDTYGSTLSNVTLVADPINNPLGVFLSVGTLTLVNDVNIQGTIITSGTEPDIRITGTNVQMQARTLPHLEGSTVPYELPVAIIKDDFCVYTGAGAKVRGLVAAWDEFTFLRGDSACACEVKGRVVCNRLNLNGRIPWDLSLTAWQSEYLSFTLQAVLGGNAIKYYPVWLQQTRGMAYKPLLTIKPDSAEIVHRWQVWNQPIYVAADGDSGLRWNLIDWTDNPQSNN